jgi:hypothetical protein
LAGLSYFIFGAGPIVWTVTTTTLRQTVTRSEQLGRIGALFLTANAGARPLGSIIGAGIGLVLPAGPAASACLVVAAVGFCIQGALIFLSTLRHLDELPPSVNLVNV